METIDYAKVGLKMKQLRNEQGFTQEKVAQDLDCTVAFISNVENNRAKLNLRVLQYYSRLCNVSVDTILNAGISDAPPSSGSEERLAELERIFRMYTDEEQEKIIRILKLWKKESSL